MTTFTNVFGNDTVPPSENSYAAYSISVSSDMVWPNSYSGTGLLVAEIIEISATAGGLSVDLPPANEMSVGAGILLRNTGANDININDADGSNLTSIAVGVVKFLYISDNSSSAGVWGIFTFGTGTSSADASTLAGFGLRVWMAKLVPNHAYIEKNGNYTVLDSDRNKLINVTAGSITITLPLASSVEAGFHVLIRNSSIGTVTVDGNGTESINNELTFELQPGESAIFVCSGSGWFTVGYGRDVEFMFSEFVINAAAGNVNLSSTDVSGRMIRVGGTAVGNIVVTLPAIDNIYFVNVESGMGAFTVTFTTGSGSTVVMLANQRTALYSDGTNITAAITTSLVSTIALDDGSAAVPTLFFVLDTNTGMFRRAEGELGITSNGVEVAYFGADGLHADGGFFGGDTAQVVSGFTSNHLQSMGAGSDVGFSASLWQNTANPPDIQFMKSRGASISTHVIVQNGDNTLSITAAGDDGVAFIQSARITASIDGVPGVNDMPGRLGFWTTPDGSSGVVERMRIDSTGLVAITGTETITANSSSDAFRVNQTGSGNVFVAEDSASPDSSPFIIDAAGRMIAGHTASIVFRSALAATGQFIETTGQLGVGIDRSSADANPGNLVIRKSRGADPGAVTIVQNGDGVGGIFFTATDGVAPIDCANISAAVDGTPGVNDMPGRLTLSTTADGASTSTERMRINSSGQILVGHTASITGTGGLTPRQQLSGTTISTSSQSLNAFSVTSTDAATFQLNKSANAAVGSHTIVVDGEQVGNVYFSGSDGAAFIRTAMIRSEVDGVPGVNDMPGRLIFGTTADGGTVPTERMRIDSTGKVSIPANNSTGALTINQLGAGHALLIEDSASPDATPFLIEASGVMVTGHTSTLTTKQYNNAGSVTPWIQQHGTDLSTTTIATNFWANSAASCSEIILSKSRGVVGVQTIVQNADILGALVFNASDGAAFQTAATIIAAVDAAPGVNDMPGRLMFSTTPDGSVTPTERMRIISSGFVGIGSNAPLSELHVNGSDTSTDVIRITSAPGVGQQEIGIGFVPAGPTLANPSAAVRALEFDTSDARAHLLFYVRDSNADVVPIERMRIASSGNILIGTTTDDGTKLQVNGNAVISSQFRFSSAAAAILNANNTGQIDIDHAPVDGTSVGLIRFYRNTTTTGAVRVGVSPGDGTATFNHLLVGKGGDTYLVGLSGNLLVGHTVSITGTGGITPKVQVDGTSTATSSQSLNTFSVTDTEAATFQLNKSGNAAVGSHTIVASGEQLGNIYFSGSDGVGFIRATMIRSEVDGTPGVNDMPGRLIFATTADGAAAPTERMRINAAGNILISSGAVDNGVGKLQVTGQSTYTATAFYAQTTTSTPGVGNTTEGGAIQISGAAAIFRGSRTSGPSLTLNRNTTDGAVAEFHRDGVAVGSISVTTTATAYNTSSDYRLKDNIQDLVGSGEFIDKLQPKTWDWISDKSRGVGFIAHELQMISPLSVTGEFNEVDENGEPIYQGVEYGSAEVIAMMVAELKSLRQRVAILESK